MTLALLTLLFDSCCLLQSGSAGALAGDASRTPGLAAFIARMRFSFARRSWAPYEVTSGILDSRHCKV